MAAMAPTCTHWHLIDATRHTALHRRAVPELAKARFVAADHPNQVWSWDATGAGPRCVHTGRIRARTPGGELMAYHHRSATIALTLALALGVPAITAAAQQPNKPGSPASAGPCSEVCSGGGYVGNSNTTRTAYSLPAILNGASDPGPCSEVCSGGGYGSVSRPSWTPGGFTPEQAAVR
jgi:hypothetical protein